MSLALAPAHALLSTPLLAVGADGVVADANPACAQWLGVGVRRLPGLPLVALEFEGDALARWLDETASGDQARIRRLPLAFPGMAPRFADVWLTRLQEGGWLLEAHPVDEFPGEDPVAALPSALSAALKGLAHELRNPLAGLKGAAQLLSPAPPRPHAPLNIHAVLERVLRLAESDAGWAVRLARDYDPSLPELDGDEDRLVQATWNLVRNAIEAGAANVTLRTRAEHGVRIGDAAHALALRLDIVDDGRGVPEELAEQVFLPLVSGRAEGSGLGLALAQQVAREHRGSLAYRSRPGHTVFTLLLPLREAEEAGND
jgi:two-component system nitrogen regulation sensor histidine kinase GlnL